MINPGRGLTLERVPDILQGILYLPYWQMYGELGYVHAIVLGKFKNKKTEQNLRAFGKKTPKIRSKTSQNRNKPLRKGTKPLRIGTNPQRKGTKTL